MMGFGFGMGLWGIFIMLLFWGGLIALAVWLVGLMFPSSKIPRANSEIPRSAEEILKIRYARGEITETEYKQMKETLLQQSI